MKKLLSLALSASFMFGMQGASAADVSGNVVTKVKTGLILQSNKGIANKNVINIGSVTGKASVDGNFRSTVKTGAIIQTNTGIANKNTVNIGSISR